MKFSLKKVINRTGFALILFTFCNSIAFGQLGYSSAAMGMGKMNARSGLIPTANQVIVEEYFNYHKHVLKYPQKNESVALTISRYESPDKSLILQVGLCTDTISDLNEIPPVNVCLVIDRSGSMAGDRIEKTKEASIEFVKRLREKDLFSLVLFDDQIEVLIPAGHVNNKNKIIDIIRGIEIRGSTDLNGGIIEGYTEVLKNYKKGQNNKVIVLTDALTNTGIVDPIQIVAGTNKFKEEHEIDITMVGVGVDFNNDLSRDITSSNRSSIFFVNDAEDIKKVFIDEIESLLSPVGREVKLEITLSPDMEIDKCFGYSPAINGNKLEFTLENMNSGLTQVVLIKLKPKNGGVINENNALVTAKLDYYDIANKNKASIEATANIQKNQFDNTADVQKNYCIARMAQCIKDIAVLNAEENYKEAKYRADFILKSTDKFYPNMTDIDIKRVYDILSKYRTILNEYLPETAASLTFPY